MDQLWKFHWFCLKELIALRQPVVSWYCVLALLLGKNQMLLPVITSRSLAGNTQHMTGKRPAIPAWKISRTNLSHTRNRNPSLNAWDYSSRKISLDITKVKRLTENILLCETYCSPCGVEQHLFPHQTLGHFEAYSLMLFMANEVMLKQQTCAYIQHWDFFWLLQLLWLPVMRLATFCSRSTEWLYSTLCEEVR